MIAIQTANLTKKYGDIIAINGVDLEVEAGEIVGCLGPERSGKTTLLRLLTGLVRPTLGDSTVLGLSSVKESRKLRAKSGIVTDTAACIGIVKQNIVFSLIIKFGCLALTAFGLANMWAAIFADVGVMIIAVLNAIRALKYKE